MKKIHILTLLISLFALDATAQLDGVQIDYSGTPPTRSSSALLELNSTTQGILVPRLQTSQRTGITSPANGLLVYDTDLKRFYYYDLTTTSWIAVGTSSGNGFIANQTTQQTASDFNIDGSGTLGGNLNLNGANLNGPGISGGSNAALNVNSNTGLVFNIDQDNNSTTEALSINKDAVTPVVIINEAGLVNTIGDMLVQGSDVYDNSGDLRLSGEDNVQINMDYNANDLDIRTITFGKNSQTAPTELMRIQENGTVAIGTITPDPSAILDITSTTQGVLVPRLNSGQRISMSAPATGLLVYDTVIGKFYYYDGSAWIPVGSGNGNGSLTSFTADNGLTPGGTLTDPTVILGGSLNQPTTITQDSPGETFTIANNSSANTVINLQSTGDFNVQDNGASTFFISDNGTIGINNASPNTSAILDITSTTKGLLPPRMTNAQRNAIPSPAQGLVIFNTTSNCIELFSGAWQSIYCACPNLAALNAIAGSTTVCAGTNQTYSVPSITGASTYTWTVTGNPAITGQGSNIISFTAPALSVYTVAVTASNACNTSSVSQNLPVNCYTAVPPTPVWSSSPTGLCQGGSYNYTVTNGLGINGTGAITYTWTVTATGTASATLTANSQTASAGSPVTYTAAATGVTLDIGGTGAGNIIVAIVGNNTCGSTITPLSLTRAVDQFTTAAAGADQTVCATTATMAGNTPVTGGGTWTLVSGAGTITTPTLATTGITALGLGANTFRWTFLNGACTDSQDDVIITRNDFTTAAAGPDQTLCATTSTFAGNTPTTGGGTWTLVSGNGTITSPTSPTSGVTALGLGANTFRWTLLNGVCADSQDDVVITRDDFTTAAAGADQTVCATTATFAGNTPATGGGTWTLVSGAGTITTPTSPTSGVTALGLGANTFRWTLLNGVCADSQDDVIITRNDFTTAAAGPDQTVCATTATFAGNTPATGGGTWTLVSGSGTITTPTSPTSGVTALGLGANTFRWTLLNGVCTDSQDDVVITRNDFTAAAAGVDQSVCATSATFAGNTPATGGGTWTLVSGNGTITTPTSPTSGVTALGLGANTFRWTLLNGVCADSQDDVIITRDDFTTAAAGPDQTVCATIATLAGNTPVSGGGTWTLIGGAGTITTPTSPTSGITGLGLGANTFRWTLLNGVCSDSQDDVIITRNDFTTAAAGPDQTVCATTATFAGNTPATGGGTWTLISGNGTITSPTSPTSGVTALGLGANTFRWTLLNGVCTDSQDDVIITRNDFTTAAAGADQTVCATTATFAGNTPATGGGTWTLVSGAGTITSPTSPTSGVTALGLGANTFRWTLLNGVCTDSQDDVIITRNDFTTAAAGADQTVCATTATFAGNTPATGGGTWTLVSGNGTITTPTSPTSGVTALGLGANTFRWTLLNGVCADSQDDVIITRNDFTTAAAGPDQSICGTTATLAGNTPATGNGTWTLVGGSGSITTPTSPTSGLTGLGVGANTFRWTLLNGVCADSQDDVIITATATPAAPTSVTASPSTITQGNSTNLNATSAGNTILWYTVASGGTSIGSSASGANFSVTPAITTTYYAEATTSSVGSQTFSYNGTSQTFTVPAGVNSITIQAWGAQGGSYIGAAGLGGYATGTLSVSPGQQYTVYVGGQGTATGGYSTCNGGYNGGGYAYGFDGSSYGASGGGASDVRNSGGTKLIVAGGGGGGGYFNASPGSPGGAGGGTTGGTGAAAIGYPGYTGGGGGTQSAGGAAGGSSSYAFAGSLGLGANQTASSGGWTACGGGGGYYGGGSGGALGAGGGGGSSYTGGVTSGSTTAGVRSSNGQVTISWNVTGCPSPTRTPVTVTVNACAYAPGSANWTTPGSYTWTVPCNVSTVNVDARGGAGGTGQTGAGGNGGRIQTSISTSGGTVFNIYVGGAGGSYSGTSPGYNGGGNGSTSYPTYVGAGGGASDIRIGGIALGNRVVVAGGGGGGGYNGCTEPGGAGGGSTGASGAIGCAASAAGGGTQSAGGAGGNYGCCGYSAGGTGSLGQGGTGGPNTGSGGGGGGYYGGGGGSWNGGGGGSSYPSGGTHTQGFQAGNGAIYISW